MRTRTRSEVSTSQVCCDRHLWRVRAARKHWNDSGRFRYNRSGQHNEVGVSSAVLWNLRPDVQRVSLQQTLVQVWAVPLHRRVGDNRWSLIQQFIWTRILSTTTMSRLDSHFLFFIRHTAFDLLKISMFNSFLSGIMTRYCFLLIFPQGRHTKTNSFYVSRW